LEKDPVAVLAKIAKALNAPGVMHDGHIMEISDSEVDVTATINPEEFKNAKGDLGKLKKAAKNKVVEGELSTERTPRWVVPEAKKKSAMSSHDRISESIVYSPHEGEPHHGIGQSNVRGTPTKFLG
jgi:hypothetical protein